MLALCSKLAYYAGIMLNALACLFIIVYVYTIDPDSTKDEEPSVAAVNKQPSKGSQLSDSSLLDGPPCYVCMFVCMHVRMCV